MRNDPFLIDSIFNIPSRFEGVRSTVDFSTPDGRIVPTSNIAIKSSLRKWISQQRLGAFFEVLLIQKVKHRTLTGSLTRAGKKDERIETFCAVELILDGRVIFIFNLFLFRLQE